MEFKEIKVASLSKEDKALFKEVEKAREEANRAEAKAETLQRLFWARLKVEHSPFWWRPLY